MGMQLTCCRLHQPSAQCHVLQRERVFRAGAALSGEADGVFNGE